MTTDLDLRPDPIAAAIHDATHALGFHLGQITTQLARIHDTLQRIADQLDDVNHEHERQR